MRTHVPALCLALLICGRAFGAADVMAPAPASPADERLVFSADGGTLTGGHGAGGGAITWLRNVGTGGVIGVGAEYQEVFNAHWTLGALTGSLTLGEGDAKTNLYAEAHEGAGDIGTHAFHYSVITAGAIATLASRFSVQLEERRLDIDKSHGNLPKLGLSLRVTPQLQASASYAHSIGGNLGTKLWTARLDYTGKMLDWLAGGAWGPVSPAALNYITSTITPANGPLHEGFAGVGKTFGRTHWLVVGDFQDLNGTKRTTVTLVCTVHLGAHGQPR
jgi:hypothetical protein